MSMPMRYDDSIRLCGGTRGQTIQQMLLNHFSRRQVARFGTYADRERAYLIDMGCTPGTRYDMWKQYMNMKPDNYWWGDPEGTVAAGAAWTRVLNRTYVGAVAAGAFPNSITSKTAGA